MNRRGFMKLAALTAFGFVPDPEPIFLPFVSKYTRSNVGVESEGGFENLEKYYNDKTRLKVSVRWSEVEAVCGQYDWSTLDRKLGSYHADWITVKCTPDWALPDGEPMCKLPSGENWAAFHKFVQAVIDRYGPEFIEIWNEPDVLYEDMPPENAVYFGCVGDASLYGEFCEKLYGNVTGAKIIIGAVSSIDDYYIRDMLVEAKGKFDGISFHCYEYYYSGLSDTCRSEYKRIAGMTDKPVYISETAVIYREGSLLGYYDAQIEQYWRLKKDLLTPWFWYTLVDNWPQPVSTDMIGPDGPRPIWYEYNKENR